MENKILIGKGDRQVHLLAKMANRHGLIAGATGTGKTVSLKLLAEGFSNLGVPVFITDIKGDISGIAKEVTPNDKLMERAKIIGMENYLPKAFPTDFFDVFQKKGHPLRTSISDLGPEFIARLLDLSKIQTSVLQVAFQIADDSQLKIINLKDLKALINFLNLNKKKYEVEYGKMSSQSLNAITRSITVLEQVKADLFFSEPEFEINDFMQNSSQGKISILECQELFQSPLLYSTIILWLLSELYESLDEIGDLEKPRLVFFFDEAHILFKDGSKVLTDKIEQLIKLIRSKGVAIFFCTQNPYDIPDAVLAQLSNRIQHSLRCYSTSEIKKVKSVAQSFRPNPSFSTFEAITSLKTGEALVSVLDEEGVPSIVEKCLICPTQSSFDKLEEDKKNNIINNSMLKYKYNKTEDSYSAYEMINEILEEIQSDESSNSKRNNKTSATEKMISRTTTNTINTFARESIKDMLRPSSRSRKSPMEKAGNTLINSITREVSKGITRGIFGIFKK